jgi:hypothetical protein
LAACEKAHIARPAASWRAADSSSFIPGRGVPAVLYVVSVVILYRSFVGCLVAVIRLMLEKYFNFFQTSLVS